VTGFGLAGHLLEMLVASNASAQVDLATVPLLPGAVELCQAGFESTLAAANRAAEAAIRVDDAKRTLPAYQLLFDPQTNGGLLMGVSEDKLGDVQNTAARLGLTAPWIIGRVERLTNAAPQLRCQ
jgi:selenide,water dikinase